MKQWNDDDLDELFYEDTDVDKAFAYMPDLDDILELAEADEPPVTIRMDCTECKQPFLVGSAYDHTAENAEMCPRCRKSWQDFMERVGDRVIQFPHLPSPKAA